MSLLDEPLRPHSPPPSPLLITLEVVPNRPTLLDLSSEFEHREYLSLSDQHYQKPGLRPTALEFIPSNHPYEPARPPRSSPPPPTRDFFQSKGVKPALAKRRRDTPHESSSSRHSVSSPESIKALRPIKARSFSPDSLVDLDLDQTSVYEALRPRRHQPQSYLSLCPSPFPSPSLSPRLARLASRHSSTSLSSSDRSVSPTRTYSDTSLPDLVATANRDAFQISPASSFSSRHATPGSDNDPGVILTDPNDLEWLFKFDLRAFPAPDLTVNTWKGKGNRLKTLASDKTSDDLIDICGREDEVSSSQTLIVLAEEQSHAVRRATRSQIEAPEEDLLVDILPKDVETDRSSMNRAQTHALTGTAIAQISMPRDSSKHRYNGIDMDPSLIRETGQRKSKGESRSSENDLIDVGVPVQRAGSSGSSRDLKALRSRIGIDKTTRSTSPAPPRAASKSPYGIESPYKVLLSRPSPRSNIPYELAVPTPPDTLQSSLMRAWSATEPSPSQRAHVLKLLDDMSYMINSRLGWPGSSNAKGKRRFEVDVFGSVSWGGETGTSGDLDLVILDRDMPQGYHPSMWRTPPGQPVTSNGRGPKTPFRDLPRVYKLWDLAHNLDAMGMEGSQAILGASTPIVKFTDRRTAIDIECDVNVNDLGGWYNSSLILHYCLLSPYVLRPMIHALKLWAAAFDLNDPSGSRGPATMSSYCLTLMAIGYLQHRGILPNLQANVTAPIPSVPHKADDADTIWVGWGKEQGIKAHIGFDKTPPPGWENREPDLTAADALRGFFAYFSHSTLVKERFDYETQLISILQGGIVGRVHQQGVENREEDMKRKEWREQGISPEDVVKLVNNDRATRFEEEVFMGKGDQKIQPRNWGERMIVVQDPFLWLKNCAGSMSKIGAERFMGAIAYTHKQLKGSPNLTLEGFITNPTPVRPKTPRAPRGGRGGRGSGRGTPVSSRGSVPSRGSAQRLQL